MNIIPKELVESVKWEDHKDDYDQALCRLGGDLDEFYIVNPWFPNFYIRVADKSLSSQKCIVWRHGEDWIVKKFSKGWTKGWEFVEVDSLPTQHWMVNPDIDHTIFFEDDPYKNYQMSEWDIIYEHVWCLDPQYSISNERVWVYKLYTDWSDQGVKDMGNLTPKLDIEHNSDLPDLLFEISTISTIPLYELHYKHVWYLDPEYAKYYNEDDEKIWVTSICTSETPAGVKDMGYLTPKLDIKYNPDLQDINCDLPAVPLYDLHYKHVWYLDPKYNKYYNIKTDEKIWAAAICTSETPAGVKDMGYLTPNIDTDLDVIFISYNEPNAEENWQRVLSKAPTAMRVNGVTGIFEAHKSAAELATTDMFYVVDGDAYLADDWEFTFSPTVFDRDCVFVFNSQNPINGLVYGYGGVKIFPRNLLLEATDWSVDMTTSIGKKLKVIDRISNIAAFNTDEFATWRSAFRECVKLAAEIIDNQDSKETQQRLDTWVTVGNKQPFSLYAKLGARAGYKYGVDYRDNVEMLKQINNRDWLSEQFKLEMTRHTHNEISH